MMAGCAACPLLDAYVIAARAEVDKATIAAEHRDDDVTQRAVNLSWEHLIAALTNLDEHQKNEHPGAAAA